MSLESLTSLATETFNLHNEELNFEDWKQQLSSRSSTEKFWFTLVELETLSMMYVRSIRGGNFKLFVPCSHDITPWMFAQDHMPYVRWLTVCIGKLLSLEVQYREIFKSFVSEYFTNYST